MTKNETIEKVIENIDYVSLHMAHVEHENQEIEIYEDGHFAVLSSSSWTENQGCVARFNTGNLSDTLDYYSEGWTSYINDIDSPDYRKYLTDDGRVLTEDEMVRECVREGDHYDWIESIQEIIREEMEEDFRINETGEAK